MPIFYDFYFKKIYTPMCKNSILYWSIIQQIIEENYPCHWLQTLYNLISLFYYKWVMPNSLYCNGYGFLVCILNYRILRFDSGESMRTRNSLRGIYFLMIFYLVQNS